MAEVLSQQQIDELLGKLQSGDVDFKEIEEQSSGKRVKEYDFLSPKKFSRDQLKLLNNIFDSFARLIGLHLSNLLRVSCEAEVIQVEEEEYREFNNALNDSVLVGVLRMQNKENNIDDKRILLEMSRPVSFSILDRLLGGSANAEQADRDYTDIEVSLFEYLFRQFAAVLKNAWGNYIDVEHFLDMIETNSRLIQFIQQDESVAIVVMNLSVDEAKGTLNICLPASTLDDFFKIFDSKYVKMQRKSNVEQEKLRKDSIMSTISESSLTVSAMLGKTEITLEELLGLQIGDVLPLDTPASDSSVLIDVEDQHWFTGAIGIKKKNYAVKIEKNLQ